MSLDTQRQSALSLLFKLVDLRHGVSLIDLDRTLRGHLREESHSVMKVAIVSLVLVVLICNEVDGRYARRKNHFARFWARFWSKKQEKPKNECTPVDGTLTEWKQTKPCPTCDSGWFARRRMFSTWKRQCTGTKCGGKTCPGPRTETRSCPDLPPAVNAVLLDEWEPKFNCTAVFNRWRHSKRPTCNETGEHVKAFQFYFKKCEPAKCGGWPCPRLFSWGRWRKEPCQLPPCQGTPPPPENTDGPPTPTPPVEPQPTNEQTTRTPPQPTEELTTRTPPQPTDELTTRTPQQPTDGQPTPTDGGLPPVVIETAEDEVLEIEEEIEEEQGVTLTEDEKKTLEDEIEKDIEQDDGVIPSPDEQVISPQEEEELIVDEGLTEEDDLQAVENGN